MSVGAWSSSQHQQQQEPTYKLLRKPIQRIKSTPLADAPPAQEPYAYSIGDPRLDYYLPTYWIVLKDSLQQVDMTVAPPVEHIVQMSKRLPGSRAPLHTHDHGGVTCVIQGQMTLFSNNTALVRVQGEMGT